MDDVIIVGGGLAGLCCALQLHDQGIPFQLYEASNAVGGRVRTDHVDGFLLDRGFQVMLTSYPEAQRVLDCKALNLQTFYPGALVRCRGGFHLMGDPVRKPGDLWTTLTNPVGSWRDKVRMASLRAGLMNKTPEQLLSGQDIPTADWLIQRGFSEIMVERFFRPFLGGVFLDERLATSSRMFCYVFNMFATGNASVPRDGMGAIPAQILGSLPRECIHLNTPVSEITPNRITLADGTRKSGRCVVVATSLEEAARWLPDVPQRTWGGTTCFYFDAPKPPVKKPILVLNGEGRGVINTLNVASRVNPGCAPPGRTLVSVSVIGIDRDPESLEQAVRQELHAWFGPQTDVWRCMRTYTIPHALPEQSPGVLEPPERSVRTDSGIFVCGDHRDQSSIQGAMVSGRRAAEAVLTDHGKAAA